VVAWLALTWLVLRRMAAGHRSWPEEDPVIMTVALVGDDPGEYFEPGDHFAFWLGHDLGQGVVTRRLFV
jgi:hypothetical protein